MITAPKPQNPQADAGERAHRAWRGRVAGMTWAQAAEHAGFTTAANGCRAVKTYSGTLPTLDREQERELWRARGEVMWRQSMQDMHDQRPGAVRAAVAVSQRSAQLFGLDEATRVDLRATVDVRSDSALLVVISEGGLPTAAERAAYGMTLGDINDVRGQHGLEALPDGVV